MNNIYKITLLVLLSSFVFSSSISIEKNLVIKNLKKGDYLNFKNRQIKTKKNQLINPKISKFGHKISKFGHPLKISINKTYQRNMFRNSYVLINFECIEGPNAGFNYIIQADFNQGQYIMPDWSPGDYVCVTVQQCIYNVENICSDIVGPICIYVDSGDQICFDDINQCDNQLLGDTNNDGSINIIDIVIIVNYILDGDLDFQDCSIISSDFNNDQELNVLDIIDIINLILSNNY